MGLAISAPGYYYAQVNKTIMHPRMDENGSQ